MNPERPTDESKEEATVQECSEDSEQGVSGEHARSFEKVLAAETRAVIKGRALRRDQETPGCTGAKSPAEEEPRLSALAFSGGGIRSAIFNLGVIQGLARLRLLRCFDYLSMNSGGGYIGGWLLAWIRRDGIRKVEEELRRDACRDDQETGDPKTDAEAEPISFLRRFSNYLTPQVGALTVDTWTMVTSYLRNLLLNQVILVLALAAMLLIPRLLVLASSWFSGLTSVLPFLCGVVALAVAIVLMACNQMEVMVPRHEGTTPWYAQQRGILIGIVLPFFLAAWIAGLWMWFSRNDLHSVGWIVWILGGAILYFFVWVIGIFVLHQVARRRGRENPVGDKKWMGWVILIAALFAGATGGALLKGLASFSHALPELLSPVDYTLPAWHLVHVNVWKAPAITVVFIVTAFVHTGLMGREFPEALRQWWSRVGAWLLIWSITWLGVFAIALYGPILLVVFGAVWCTFLGGGWIASTLSGVLVGRQASDREQRPKVWRRVAIALAPQIFILGMLAGIALGVHAILDPPEKYLSEECKEFWIDAPAEINAPTETDVFAEAEAELTAEENKVRRIVHCHTERLYLGITRNFKNGTEGHKAITPLALLLCAISALGLSWRVDINEFSMHLFYRNRLIRAFLGASNRNRNAQPFTGFDPDDDLPVSIFSPEVERDGDRYDGPYPMLNVALNLVSGRELAWQERKATSFVFTPLFSGYHVHDGEDPHPDLQPAGYRPTCGYQQMPKGGISLGTAMTISGAAASPSMGAGTTPAMAFLLTVFNVRLGWWLGNPRHDQTWYRMGPTVGIMALLAELFGTADDRSRYVYLSDGGHFDNLGLYELIRRRCRFIVVSDAGADPDMTFEDLGNAVRKCCTDFGVEIEINPDQIHKDPESGLSNWHCAVGTIRYDEAEGSPPGILVYVKTSLTGDEPIDAQAYATAHQEFPHQATSDQWFSETQFESYRKLGEHVVLSVFGAVDDRPGELSREDLYVRLSRSWYPPSNAPQGAFPRLTNVLDKLMERLRNDPELEFLIPQIYPEWSELAESVPDAPDRRMWLPKSHNELVAGFIFSHSLIQLMEDCYLDLDLDSELGHPDNRGWMNLFKHWSWAGMVRATWAVTAGTFGARFQVFCHRRLGLEVGRVRIEQENVPQGATLDDLIKKLATGHRLNFLEQELVKNLVEKTPEIDQLLILRLTVQNPEQLTIEDPNSHQVVELAFTFGVGLAHKDELVYLRVQDHLRKMGLARRALRQMIREGIVEEITPLPLHALPAWCRETPGEAAREKLRQLFRSAQQQEQA